MRTHRQARCRAALIETLPQFLLPRHDRSVPVPAAFRRPAGARQSASRPPGLLSWINAQRAMASPSVHRQPCMPHHCRGVFMRVRPRRLPGLLLLAALAAAGATATTGILSRPAAAAAVLASSSDAEVVALSGIAGTRSRLGEGPEVSCRARRRGRNPRTGCGGRHSVDRKRAGARSGIRDAASGADAGKRSRDPKLRSALLGHSGTRIRSEGDASRPGLARRSPPMASQPGAAGG